jgi:hypothetical protein
MYNMGFFPTTAAAGFHSDLDYYALTSDKAGMQSQSAQGIGFSTVKWRACC